ncbi:hypothetical protein [Spirosoma telluris]|uniref:hypothetical protein n=1 Tax=Spirosoma telluris TaxID=2183553 RepID=UPI0018DE7AD7
MPRQLPLRRRLAGTLNAGKDKAKATLYRTKAEQMLDRYRRQTTRAVRSTMLSFCTAPATSPTTVR